MKRRPYRQERLDAIMNKLEEAGFVTVAEMSDAFGVSEVTIRSDLDVMEQAGQLVRTHGGAVPLQGENALSFSVRQRTRVQAKERIGAAAAAFVSDGEPIVLDASTTAWHLARCLLSRRDLTVVTTGLYVALELLRSPSITVLMPGGPIWREAASVVGVGDLSVVQRGNLRRGFFGGRGLTLEEGLTDANGDEVNLKRALVSAVREVNVILDSSKLGKVAFASCASLQQIHRLVTDRDAPMEMVEAFRERGVEVVLA